MSEVEQMAAVLAEHAGVTIRRLPADRRGICRNERVCTCGEVMPWDEQGATDAHCAHVAAELARAGFGAVGDGCCDHDAEAHNLGHEVDRVRERLWRLAALAGWRPGNPADNDATAELYVTEGLACAEAAMASAKAEALREAADALYRFDNPPPMNGWGDRFRWYASPAPALAGERMADWLRDRADQIARTDESERA